MNDYGAMIEPAEHTSNALLPADAERLWRGRRVRRSSGLLVLVFLNLASLYLILGAFDSTVAGWIRRTIGLGTSVHGSYHVQLVDYAIIDDGRIFRQPQGSDEYLRLIGSPRSMRELSLLIYLNVTIHQRHWGFWALTREQRELEFDVIVTEPSDADPQAIQQLIGWASDAIATDFAQALPAWWREHPLPDYDTPVVRRILWWGVAQNIASATAFLLFIFIMYKWQRARSIHRRLHFIVVKQQCPACRYSLKGLTEPRCPECGASLVPHG